MDKNSKPKFILDLIVVGVTAILESYIKKKKLK